MFNCPKCSALLGHCPNFCDFCGEKIPKNLIYRQRISEDVALAKLEELEGGLAHLITRINPVRSCNPFTHWSSAWAVKRISDTAPGLFGKTSRFCGNCGEELPDLSNMSDIEITEKLQFFSNESGIDE